MGRISINVLQVDEFYSHFSIVLRMLTHQGARPDPYQVSITSRSIEIWRLGSYPKKIISCDSFLDHFNPKEQEVLMAAMLDNLKPQEVDLIYAACYLLKNQNSMINNNKTSVYKLLDKHMDKEKYDVIEPQSWESYLEG